MLTDAPFFRLVETTYRRFIAAACWLQSPLLLAARVIFGYSFVGTGWGKLTHLDKTTGYFESIQIPLPHLNAILAATTETVGGVMLLVGLASRLISVPLAFTMVIAYATAEHDALADLDKFTSATPFAFLFTVLVVLAFGPGVFSLDWLIAKFVVRRASPVVLQH